MTLKVQGLMLPGREISTITVTAVVDAVEVNSIAVYTGATVSESRQVEIIDAWQMLVNGIRDRNLMQTFGGIIYSGVDIDDISEASRRTDSVLANFTDNDVIIGIGANVVGEFLDWVVMLETGFGVLSDQAQETTLKAA